MKMNNKLNENDYKLYTNAIKAMALWLSSDRSDTCITFIGIEPILTTI